MIDVEKIMSASEAFKCACEKDRRIAREMDECEEAFYNKKQEAAASQLALSKARLALLRAATGEEE